MPVTAQVKMYLLKDLERVSTHAQDETQSILLTTRTTGEVDEVAICIYEGKRNTKHKCSVKESLSQILIQETPSTHQIARERERESSRYLIAMNSLKKSVILGSPPLSRTYCHNNDIGTHSNSFRPLNTLNKQSTEQMNTPECLKILNNSNTEGHKKHVNLQYLRDS